MSAALRTAAKHARTASRTTILSQQPLRRTFYTPSPALQYSQLPNSSTKSATATVDETAHEHEREHAARTVHVVAEPNTTELKFYGVPMGAYPNATPYHHPAAYAAPAAENANVNVSLGRFSFLLLYCTHTVAHRAHCAVYYSRHRRRQASPVAFSLGSCSL